MRAHFVDRLLADLEGAVSPIWITMMALTDEPPSAAVLRQAVWDVFESTARFGVVWQGRWVPRRWSRQESDSVVVEHRERRPHQDFLHEIVAQPASLESAPAMRVHLAPVDVEGRALWAVAVQLHHALGDARALGHVLDRLWRAAGGEPLSVDESPLVLMDDWEVLRWIGRHPRAALGLMDPQRRLLSRRAVALPRDGQRVGRPIHHGMVFGGLASSSTRELAEIFFAALLVQAALTHQGASGCLRLRVPIDLSPQHGWRGVLGNTCMAVPLEFDVVAVRERAEDAVAMRRLFSQTLGRALAQDLPVTTALECLISARLVPTGTLRRGAGGGFTASPRTNTMVTTHIGNLDAYFERAPFPLLGALSHTSTWGAHAWTLRGHMGLNVTAFEGLWRRQTLEDFAQGCARWIEAHGLGQRMGAGPLWEGV